MPTAKNLTPIEHLDAVHAAAKNNDRIRVRGVIIRKGTGYSGSYRNTWLHVRTAGTTVHVTSGNQSPLGTARTGSQIDLVCTMTGMLDVSVGVYFGERAMVLHIDESLTRAMPPSPVQK